MIPKEKYFREATFLTASVGNNPSYAWRSIMKARGVLERAFKCGVINGFWAILLARYKLLFRQEILT
jgi:hypothetical protein